MSQAGSLPSPGRPNKGLILDGIHPTEFLHRKVMYACEHCSYFDDEGPRCTLGHRVEPHLKANQDQLYNLTGKLALCRFLEID